MGDREPPAGQPGAVETADAPADAPGEPDGESPDTLEDDGPGQSVAVSRTGLRCGGQRPNGDDCGGFVVDIEPGGQTGYCWNCSPHRRQERAEARRRGGLRSRGGGQIVMEGARLQNARGLVRLWDEVWAETGQQRPGNSRIRNRIALLALGAKLLETVDYEERLAHVESAMRRGGLIP